MTEHQNLQLQAARWVLHSKRPPHPTLSLIPLGRMTKAQLAELIAYCSEEPAPEAVARGSTQ